MTKEITLALGGGGSKGNAHIGVLRALDRMGYKVKAIAGTSAGGLVGCLYASGFKPDEIEARFSELDTRMLYQRDPNDAPAMMGVAGVRQLLTESLGDCTFADLPIPFAVTAVDLDTAEHLVLNSGRVVDAVMATIAVPGIFPPIRYNRRTLVDGGILDPVPVASARAISSGTAVVAVVLSPPIDEWSGMSKPRLLNNLPIISRYLSRLRIAQSFNIFLRSMDISGSMLTELLLLYDQPDVVIRPAVPHVGLLDIVEVEEVARLGERATEEAIPELDRAVSFPARIRRKFSPRLRQPVKLPYSSSLPADDHDEVDR